MRSADVAPENGDPEGQRTLKNMILLTAGNHGTISLALNQQTNIYDDGGPEGDGADGVEATITFAPTGDADCIRLTDRASPSDTPPTSIYIKGGEVNDDKLIVDFTGSSAKFDPIISDATVEGGKLTIKYVGKGSYSRPNFAIEAEGYKKTDVVVTAVTTEDISVSEVLKGQTDVKMLKIAVEAKGETLWSRLDITRHNSTSPLTPRRCRQRLPHLPNGHHYHLLGQRGVQRLIQHHQQRHLLLLAHLRREARCHRRPDRHRHRHQHCGQRFCR